MNIENNVEFNSSLNVEGEPRSTEIKFYYNKKTNILKKVTLDSKDEEIILFPIKLESGFDYTPNLYELNFNYKDNPLLVEEYVNVPLVSFEELDFALETSLERDGFDKVFLKFLKQNLPKREYARFVIEQIAVRTFLFRNKNHVPPEIYNNHIENLIIQWPDYYPGSEEYGMEYLPCSKDLQYAHILNKVLCVCSDSSKYPFEKEYFSYKELKEIDEAFNAAKGSRSLLESYPNRSKLAQELLEYSGYDHPGRSFIVLNRYLDLAFKLENSKGEIEVWKGELKSLAAWADKDEMIWNSKIEE